MDDLSQVLQRFHDTLKETAWNKDSSPTPQHGSTSDAGSPTIPMTSPVSKGSLQTIPSGNHPGMLKATDSQQNTGKRLNASDKELLAITLSRVCALQGQYGKTPAELETLVEGFVWVLGHHPIQSIIDAIGQHIRKSRDIPAPADIEAIINPPPPKIDWPLYIELKKRLRDGNVYVDRDEKRFIQNCEDIAILRQRGEFAAYNDAQRQIEYHSQRLLSYDAE